MNIGTECEVEIRQREHERAKLIAKSSQGNISSAFIADMTVE
jgi:hypothetical protein